MIEKDGLKNQLKPLPFMALIIDRFLVSQIMDGKIDPPKGEEENAKLAIKEVKEDLKRRA